MITRPPTIEQNIISSFSGLNRKLQLSLKSVLKYLIESYLQNKNPNRCGIISRQIGAQYPVQVQIEAQYPVQVPIEVQYPVQVQIKYKDGKMLQIAKASR